MVQTSEAILQFASSEPLCTTSVPIDTASRMKSAAAFATFVALSLCVVGSEEVPNAPALRGLRVESDTPTVHETTDESKKERRRHHHHHHHVKKVKKIAIPVPVGVPRFIPVPISVPSTVVASSDTATIVDSSTNVAAGATASGAVGSRISSTAAASGTEPVTPAPTTANGRPAATAAATVTRPSRPTPAPTRSASAGLPSGRQQQPGDATPSRDAGVIGDLSSRPTAGRANNAFGAGPNALGTSRGLPASGGSLGENPTDNRGFGFGGSNRMASFGGGMFGGAGGFNGNGVGNNFGQRAGFGPRNGFGQQQVGIGPQIGSAFGGTAAQGAMASFGQGGNNGFSRSPPTGFGSAALGGSNAMGGRRLTRRDVQRRR
ncbi:unnamed protein product [Hyaloperonospora brassicae]|uniref:RxLR effector candidate protein n=1 Tax=Hyaloperonospora brassicae TaxID=162125 RepID=A0AAV0TEL4_HYABA|nr:unnamed protein product [Hyaloperonospora brassicae]CAI5720219.1 unnamed protein product [Hyaloperonospora brassicae]